MDAAPRAFDELPRDPELGVPVPFACGTVTGFDGSSSSTDVTPSVRELDKRRVTQCALSRVCAVCGAGLGRPLAILGTRSEVDRNAFHVPPAHLECAEALGAAYAGVEVPVLGLDEPPAGWLLVTTAHFEFVRPNREDLDRRPTFQPAVLLSEAPARTSSLSRRAGDPDGLDEPGSPTPAVVGDDAPSRAPRRARRAPTPSARRASGRVEPGPQVEAARRTRPPVG